MPQNGGQPVSATRNSLAFACGSSSDLSPAAAAAAALPPPPPQCLQQHTITQRQTGSERNSEAPSADEAVSSLVVGIVGCGYMPLDGSGHKCVSLSGWTHSSAVCRRRRLLLRPVALAAVFVGSPLCVSLSSFVCRRAVLCCAVLCCAPCLRTVMVLLPAAAWALAFSLQVWAARQGSEPKVAAASGSKSRSRIGERAS